MTEIDDPEDAVKITKSVYVSLSVLGFVAILFLPRQILTNWRGNNNLIIPLIFFILFTAFNLNCVDIEIKNQTDIRLIGLKKIEFSELLKFGRIPVMGMVNYLFFIVYLNKKGLKKIKFFYMSYRTLKYCDVLKKNHFVPKSIR